MLIGALLMLLVGISWIIWGIFMGRGPKDGIPSDCLVFFIVLVATVCGGLIGLFQGVPMYSTGNLIFAGVLVLGGFLNGFQLYFMSLAMQRGPNGIIWVIMQSAFIIPFLVGVCLFDTASDIFRWSGFFIIVIALFIIGKSRDAGKDQTYGNWKMLAFIGFVIGGVMETLNNLPSYYPDAVSLSSVWRATFTDLGATLGALGVILLNHRKSGGALLAIKKYSSSSTLWKYCIIVNLVQLLAAFFCMYPGMDLLAEANAGAIAYPLMVSSCIIVFELYCRIILKEPRTFKQWGAVVLCLAGVILLSC